MLSEFCTYLENLYSGNHYFQDTEFGRILYIENGSDKFKINLSDKARFNKYMLYHRNSARLLTGGYTYHVQSECYALYLAYSHNFHKIYEIYWHQEDYKRFMRDWRKYRGQVLQEDPERGTEYQRDEEMREPQISSHFEQAR